MSRLIDADRALETVYEQGIAHPNAYHLTNYATLILREAPTVDAIEIIHCHECLGKSTWINDPKYGCTVCNMSGMYPKNENGYCSYAIRKGDKK